MEYEKAVKLATEQTKAYQDKLFWSGKTARADEILDYYVNLRDKYFTKKN